jgi:cytochrome c oxidase cbb3-type subunit 1
MTVRGVPVLAERHDDVPVAAPLPKGAATGPAE